MPTLAAPAVRPLLKWAGGKRQLLPALRPFYPARFAGYVEPFLGSGAVFFDLVADGRLAGQPARLSDGNPDLIGCYQQVRDRPDEVLAALARLDTAHRRDGETHYYEVRDQRFNPARAAGAAYTPELAAMFVYLNRTGYNGLYRVNRAGAFNVPAGRYANPRICDAPLVHAVARALRAPGVALTCQGFDASLAGAGRGDFVYCDPPYAPLSPTANFAHYTAGGFSADDQARLQAAVVAAAGRGATVLLSNSCAPLIDRLYSTVDARRAGLRIHRVPARRAINSRASARGVVDEFVVTNAVARSSAPRPRMLKVNLRRRDAAPRGA
jgi:DNA adenine methylase